MPESLFGLPPLAQTQPAPNTTQPGQPGSTTTQPQQTANQLPAQPQVGNAPVPGATVPTTGTGTPSAPVSFARGQPVGFFTDTSVCIGCKACEVACKEWNQLPAELDPQHFRMSGNSYDNTMQLSGTTFRHVKFIEQFDLTDANRVGGRWLMMSDVCKHCVQAGCLEVCPTGAIQRTEFDTVYIQQDVCNGCRYCVAGCPFGVIQMNEQGVAGKCTFCYDRLQAGLTPACAQACPTASIQFGPVDQLQRQADVRLGQLQQAGHSEARLYGRDDAMLGGLNSFYLLMDQPNVYGLPEAPQLPSTNLPASGGLGVVAAVLAGIAGILAFRKRRMDPGEPAAVGAPRAPSPGARQGAAEADPDAG
ncbi:MAG: 4Fe-4S dicluster domain-containing protein [Chloroflexi bacterium]|nr:4Fe-4S dicluster domain-containing protein [Chloroflexota bacterium]